MFLEYADWLGDSVCTMLDYWALQMIPSATSVGSVIFSVARDAIFQFPSFCF